MRTKFLLLASAIAAAIVVSDIAEGQKPTLAGANQSQTFKVSGIVTDASRVPLSLVEVAVVDSSGAPERSTKTDDRGHFDLGGFQQGTLSLRARRLGYEQWTMRVDVGAAGQPTSLEIVLLSAPEKLEDVNVTASAPPSKLRGFYERSRQKRTFARFFDQEQIRKMGPRSASELFRSVPGITLSSNQSGGNLIRIRGCQPMVWLDDQRVPGAELDDLIVPSEIAAIEFYSSSAGIPAQYLDRGNRLCGLILIWSKTGEE